MQQLTLDLDTPPQYRQQDFVVTASHREALRWIEAPDWPAPSLVIVGPQGSGKTHLAALWQQRTAAEGVRLSDPLIPEALPRAVIVDDAVTGDTWPRAQADALFHLYNIQKERGGRVLVTSRLHPREWQNAPPDLISRMLAGPVAEILPPDDTLIPALLFKQFSDYQLFVEPDVVTYLATRLERTFPAIASCVIAINTRAWQAGRRVTIPLVREVLGNVVT